MKSIALVHGLTSIACAIYMNRELCFAFRSVSPRQQKYFLRLQKNCLTNRCRELPTVLFLPCNIRKTTAKICITPEREHTSSFGLTATKLPIGSFNSLWITMSEKSSINSKVRKMTQVAVSGSAAEVVLTNDALDEDDSEVAQDEVLSLEEDIINDVVDSSNGIAKFRYPKSLGDYDRNNDDDDNDDESLYPRGNPKDYGVCKLYKVPANGFADFALFNESNKRPKLNPTIDCDQKYASGNVTQHDLDRIENISATNITLPLALKLLDPEEYPTLSRARKACRKGAILLHRGPLPENNPNSVFETTPHGKSSARVYPNDVIAKQIRMSGGFYPSMNYKKPPFDLPVIYEDDHMAIVNKPAGVMVYTHRTATCGHYNVRSALPFVLRPPSKRTGHILRRPQPVHRLDKPTSGILLVAKTKLAHMALCQQFEERRIRKTYCAILNGIPFEDVSTQLTTKQAQDLGVDVGYEDYCYKSITTVSSTTTSADSAVSAVKYKYETQDNWQLIDHVLDEQSAVTVWRPLAYIPSLNARQGYLTLVEMKPKSGRYHQLRRHMVSHICQS